MSPGIECTRAGPCVIVQVIIVATRKFVDGRCFEAAELECIQVNIKYRDLNNLNSQSEKYISPVGPIPVVACGKKFEP